MRFADKNSVQRGRWSQLEKDSSIQLEDLPGSPGEQRERASAAPLALPCQ